MPDPKGMMAEVFVYDRGCIYMMQGNRYIQNKNVTRLSEKTKSDFGSFEFNHFVLMNRRCKKGYNFDPNSYQQ